VGRHVSSRRLRHVLIPTIYVLVCLTGCKLNYLAQSGYDFAKLIRRKQLLSEAINNPETSEIYRHRLRLAQRAKEFAEAQMGLKKTRNYQSFIQLDEPYVSYIVSASPKCEIKGYLWDFPIVGRVPYLGFANKDLAAREAEKMRDQGYDTFVRGTTAFSTLGWFDDPILSSMLNGDDYDVVNTILHETVHATLFIKSSADFNEALAMFLAQKGSEDFFKSVEGPNSETLKNAKLQAMDERLFSQFVTSEIEHMQAWYTTNGQNCDLTAREKEFQALTKRFRDKILPQLKTENYKGFANTPLNNARLSALKTYYYDLTVFEHVWRHTNQDYRRFLAAMKTLESSSAPFDDLKKQESK
jgi:predicted aminopeptidase